MGCVQGWVYGVGEGMGVGMGVQMGVLGLCVTDKPAIRIIKH